MDFLGVALTHEKLNEVEFFVGTHDIFVLGLQSIRLNVCLEAIFDISHLRVQEIKHVSLIDLSFAVAPKGKTGT
jgi:hypothetical protein